MVAAGRKGIKTGEGIYQYVAGSKDLAVSDKYKKS
jgi:3-hydroxybutyryl-CoA dehydrogenase